MMIQQCQAQRMQADLEVLCETIGTRLAGTPAEAQGADYIARQFAAGGLDTEIQEFPCLTWDCRQADLQVKAGRRWRPVPVQPNTQTPSTPGMIEGEIVYLETAQPQDLAGLDLQGKIGLLFGSAYATLERLDRLCNSGLAALLYVDDRFPFDWKVASGLIAGWIDLLTIPTATIPYMHAWELVRQGWREARLDLQVTTSLSTSQNVVATIPGSDPRLPALVVGGHHDSVALGVGAEDDGSGVAVTLELARVLADSKPRRTMRFATFGWEENLSEGARQYVINPANNAAATALMLNIDSVGSWLGNNHVYCTGDRSLQRWVAPYLRQVGQTASIETFVSPFSDQFPFNLLGVPSLWLHRSNFPGGRFYHHSEHDQLAVLNFDLLAQVGDLSALLLTDLAGRRDLPFAAAIPPGQQRQIERLRREYFDRICDWQTPGLMRPTGRPWREFGSPSED
jgi:aminopeptidase YwaD